MKLSLISLLTAMLGVTAQAETGPVETWWRPVFDDHANFYAMQSAWPAAGGLLVGALLANSSLDEEINDGWQEDVRNDATDDLAAFVKPFGDGKITVPCFLGAALLGRLEDSYGICETLGAWGERSLRGLLVGVPPLLLSQRLLGGSRPTDEDGDSTWRPFEDSNAVSGHAFMGAIPFLSAAKMTDSLALKTACFAGSTLCGFSRVNDEDHYLSQVLMGWGLAYLATVSVDRTERSAGVVASVQPLIMHGYPSIALSVRF